MALADQAELAVRLSLDDRFSGQLGRAASSLGKFQAGVSRAGRGVGQLAGGLVRVGAVGVAAVGGGLTAVAKAAIDFEDAFAGVKKTVDETQLAAAGLTFDDLARSFRDMATEMPIAATELARIGETAGALGIRAQDIDEFTRTVALLGVTTNLTSDEAAESLGKVGTILGLTGQQFEDFADTLVNLGNQGASTESEIIEITKRFAAAGKQAGLSTDEILALASATASLGIEPEAAGGALSRIFANMAADIALATDSGKAFAKITGDSLGELQNRINKGEALPILLETLQGISKLSRTEAASVLQALGITNVRDRDAILKLSQNLGFVNEQLDIAKDSTGALGEESRKRFDTIASKIAVFKNGLIEAGITIGEGFLPALGRATDKLSAFLKQDQNRAALRQLGEDIGKFIDGINWEDVLSGAKSLVGVLKEAGSIAAVVVGALAKLPKEVLALGTVAIGANALSGGLLGAGVGNIAGGLGEALAKSLASRIPIFGKAFVQPVFVTNMGVGGLGGGGTPAVGAATGGAGLVGTAVGVLSVASLGAAITQAMFVGLPQLVASQPGFVPETGVGPGSERDQSQLATRWANSLLAPSLQAANAPLLTEAQKQSALLMDTRSEAIATNRALMDVARQTAANVAKTAAIGAAIAAMPPPQVSVTVPVSVKTNISVRESQQVQNGFTMYHPPTTVNHL